jgi:hypothetical protein
VKDIFKTRLALDERHESDRFAVDKQEVEGVVDEVGSGGALCRRLRQRTTGCRLDLRHKARRRYRQRGPSAFSELQRVKDI